MTIDQEVELLRNIPLFAKVDPAKLKLLAFASERAVFAPGETLFHQGDPGDAAYIIMDGEAEVLINGPGGPIAVELTSGHSFHGIGPTVSLEARHPLGDSGLAFFGKARAALLFGSAKQNALDAFTPGAGPTEFAYAEDHRDRVFVSLNDQGEWKNEKLSLAQAKKETCIHTGQSGEDLYRAWRDLKSALEIARSGVRNRETRLSVQQSLLKHLRQIAGLGD